MTSMQQDAIDLIQKLPEEKLAALLVIMRSIEVNEPAKNLTARRRAFEKLERIRRPIEGLDEKKELETWRREKFEHANIS